MRWRRVIVLWIVLAGLGAEYWWVERRRPPAAPEAQARRRFLPLDARQIDEVRVRRGGRSVVLRRAGDGWSVVEPPNASTPPDLLAAFAAALAQAEEIATVSAGADDPRPYGLGGEASHLEIVAGAGPPLRISIGDANPSGTAVYARHDAGGDVVLIGRNVRYYEDLIFQSLPAARVPAGDADVPVGG